MALSLALGAALVIAGPLQARGTSATRDAVSPAGQAAAAARIPFDQFILPNGLRVIVHTDRSVPMVAVAVYYDVGARHEPPGRGGFAHLFEHLMFNGSPNVPGSFFDPLKQAGATDINGVTSYDYTRYFETVPTGAIDRALYMESDRMGWLPAAVTQATLDHERDVVFNEKRQRESVPGGKTGDAIRALLLPENHPYRHSIIGTEQELQAASLVSVRSWFADHYGPNNAVLVLAGDIDTPTARRLATKYFADIPRGREASKPAAEVPTLDAPRRMTLRDKVGSTVLYRLWAVPGTSDPDLPALDVAATVLGGSASSQLSRMLVDREHLARRASAGVESYDGISFFQIRVELIDGVDPAKAEERLDTVLAEYLRTGPTTAEIARTQGINGLWTLAGMEWLGGYVGKAAMLGEGAITTGEPGSYRTRLIRSAAVTPEEVRRAMKRWLTRPAATMTIVPGAPDEAKDAGDLQPPVVQMASAPPVASIVPMPALSRGPIPDVGQTPEWHWPQPESTTLSNGIKVHLVQRRDVPTVRLSMLFDVGKAADPRDHPGTQELLIGMLDQGTASRSSERIAQEEERLGAVISTSAGRDRTLMGVQTLSSSLAPSVALMTDMIRRPAFDPAALERVRSNLQNRIGQVKNYPAGIAGNILPPLLYGADHPYGGTEYALGTLQSVTALTREDLIAFHRRWYRPDRLEIVAVGATTMAELKPLLEAQLGDWRAPVEAAPVKHFPARPQPAAERIILVDRPGASQSEIFAAQLIDLRGTDDLTDLASAVDILGGDFLSRISGKLRVEKGWSYGASLSLERGVEQVSLALTAPVETDHTGDAIAAIKAEIGAFLTSRGVTPEELDRSVKGHILELSSRFESSANIQGELQQRVTYGLPDDNLERLNAQYRAQTPAMLDAAARRNIGADRFVWVIVGDRVKVMPQLANLGIPIEHADAADPPSIPPHHSGG